MELLNILSIIIIFPSFINLFINFYKTKNFKKILFGELITGLIIEIKSKKSFISKPELRLFLLENKKYGLLLSNKALLSFNSTAYTLDKKELKELRDKLNSLILD